MSTKAVRSKTSPAEFFEVYMEDPPMGFFFRAYFDKPPYTIKYGRLREGQTYRFAYRLGVRRGFQDIIGESRTKLFKMPPLGKSACLCDPQSKPLMERLLERVTT